MAKTNEGSEPRATRFDVAEDACNPEAGGSPSPDRPRQPSNDLISTEKKQKNKITLHKWGLYSHQILQRLRQEDPKFRSAWTT